MIWSSVRTQRSVEHENVASWSNGSGELSDFRPTTASDGRVDITRWISENRYMKLVRWNETIDIWFRPTDCDLIFNDTFADEVLIVRLRSGKRDEQGKVWAKYTPDELNELLEFIAFAANHTKDLVYCFE